MGQIKKNFIYNIVYQLLILIIPLITTPYLSRIVGASGVGTYSYTYSITYYFMLLTLLGVNNYGNRSIAKVRDNKKELSKTFWSIYILQLSMGFLMLFFYIVYIFLFNNNYKIIAIIQGLYIISAMLDINWLFFGLEEFKKNIIRNTVVKVCSIFFIILLVKKPTDLWKYTLIMSGMTCIGQVILWPFVKKRINLVKINIEDIFKHIKPNLILFIPVIAISLYKMMDKVMLGSLATVTEVGFYENAEKINNIPLILITTLGTVMLPRMSNLANKGESKKAEEYIRKSIYLVMFLSLGMCFGLVGIAKNFAPFFFGNEFKKTGTLIMMLSIILPFVSFANVLRTQYLIPNEKDIIYIKSVFLGAIINLIMNFILIPKYLSVGACFGTIAAEISVMLYQAFAIRKDLPIKEYIMNSVPFLIKAIIMLIVIYHFNFVDMSDFLRLIIQIMLGSILYCLLNIKYILTAVDLNIIFNKLKII